MKPSLQLKLGQHLTLTPQLQQSIRLLQMSTLELNHELAEILADNPLLERLDDPFDDSVRIGPDGALDARRNAPDEPRAPGTPGAEDTAAPDREGAADAEGGDGEDSDFDAGAYDDADARSGPDGEEAYSDWGASAGPGRSDDGEETQRPELGASDASLREHLLEQLSLTNATPRDHALVECLIETLDDDGFRDQDLDELLEMLPEELGVEEDELHAALLLLQSFDPPGVGARDLRESLLLQIDARLRDGFEDPGPATLARAVVDRFLPELAAHNYAKVTRALRCDEDALRAAQDFIRTLAPRPAAAFAPERPVYVVPDLIVRRGRSGWIVSLNDAVMPKLRVNDVYAQLLREHRGAHSAMSGQLQEARWLIKNVRQRFETIRRVAEAIVERQSAFFVHGEIAMKPLVLREIAEALDLHESTVSRVTTHKYMLTPKGTFELKYFFGSHVATEAGGTASSMAIRALIREIVAAEDPAGPLSDGQITDLLGEQGFVVARRTVAKYRESLLIPPVAQRKAL